MPTSIHYETAEQQTKSFEELGCTVIFSMQSSLKDAAPAIIINRRGKVWKFCDPDWDVVIRQMAQLYKFLKR